MAILRVKEMRKRERAPRAIERMNELTPEESKNVLAALKVLKIRHGSWQALETQMRVVRKALEKVSTGKVPLSAGYALRVAKVAGVSVEDVLTGAFPKPGSCPMCGRGGDCG